MAPNAPAGRAYGTRVASASCPPRTSTVTPTLRRDAACADVSMRSALSVSPAQSVTHRGSRAPSQCQTVASRAQWRRHLRQSSAHCCSQFGLPCRYTSRGHAQPGSTAIPDQDRGSALASSSTVAVAARRLIPRRRRAGHGTPSPACAGSRLDTSPHSAMARPTGLRRVSVYAFLQTESSHSLLTSQNSNNSLQVSSFSGRIPSRVERQSHCKIHHPAASRPRVVCVEDFRTTKQHESACQKRSPRHFCSSSACRSRFRRPCTTCCGRQYFPCECLER